jgi:hypothetical protein
MLNTIKKILNKVSTPILSLTFNSLPTYKLLGFIIRHSRLNLHSIYFCYPGGQNYSRNYSFSFLENWFKWRPTPIGLFKQGNKWGLVLASSMYESEFTKKSNYDLLHKLILNINDIASTIGAEKISLGGILPSYLSKKGFHQYLDQAETPAKIVYSSYNILIQRDIILPTDPIILLGGNGAVGKSLRNLLDKNNTQYYVIDVESSFSNLPESIKNRPAMLIDVSRRNVLKKYIGYLWQEIVVLNETFPEPNLSTLVKLKEKGISVYHLCGVKGIIYPELPYAYRGAIPCCAIADYESDLQPIIKKLI